MNDHYLAILAHEFTAGKGSFLLQLRIDLNWDKDAFDRLTEAMSICCKHYQYSKEYLEQEAKEQAQLTDEQIEDEQFAVDYMLKKKDTLLPRWIAEGFWYIPEFTRNWTSHSSWEKYRAREPEYFKKAYEHLDALALWFFTGRSFSTDEAIA